MQHFLDLGYQVTGIDLCEPMIMMCHEKGLDAQVMDIEALAFPPQSFEGIWAVASLHHIPKASFPQILESIKRIMCSKGLLFMGLQEGKGERYIPYKDGKRFYAFWEADELNETIQPYFDLVDLKVLKGKEVTWLNGIYRNKN